jgi:hypothetical protein
LKDQLQETASRGEVNTSSIVPPMIKKSRFSGYGKASVINTEQMQEQQPSSFHHYAPPQQQLLPSFTELQTCNPSSHIGSYQSRQWTTPIPPIETFDVKLAPLRNLYQDETQKSYK